MPVVTMADSHDMDVSASEALAQLERAAREQPDRHTLTRVGEAYLALGRPHEAIIPLAAATGLTDHARPASLLARALFEVGRSNEALLIAQRILRRDPRNGDAMHVMQRLAA
jgi:predicted Zn-dependent protease